MGLPRRTGLLALCALGALHCAPSDTPATGAHIALESIGPQLLPLDEPVSIVLCKTRPLPTLTTEGAFPEGLKLADGVVTGSPTRAGEYQHVTIAALDDDGNPTQVQTYIFAVLAGANTLPDMPRPTLQSGVVSFDGMSWNDPLLFAYAWDPQLLLLWPLAADSSLSGQSLPPAGASLSLTVAGTSTQGNMTLPLTTMDERIAAVAQLTWDAAMDVDLVLMPEPSLSLRVVDTGSPIADAQGNWAILQVIAAATSPGPGVIVFADPEDGQYALVALKKSGTAATGHLWLSLRDRAGTDIADQEVDAALSDSAVGGLAGEIGSGRQSYEALGVVTVAGSSVTYQPPDAAGDLFGTAGSP